jgi:hypothetical protein
MSDKFNFDDAFEDYMRSSNPKVPIESNQYRESRRCFYAGAAFTFGATLSAACDSVAGRDGSAILRDMKSQLHEFLKRLKEDKD